jgi:hypothetical protein
VNPLSRPKSGLGGAAKPKGLKVQTGVKAGGLDWKYNETLVRDSLQEEQGPVSTAPAKEKAEEETLFLLAFSPTRC